MYLLCQSPLDSVIVTRLRPLPHFATSITFLHEGALLAGHVKLQGGVGEWGGQVQASRFVSTNETDSDSEALSRAPNHGLHCCGHHCGRVGVRGEETGGQLRAGARRGSLRTGGEVRAAGRAQVAGAASYPGCWNRSCSARCLSVGTASGRTQWARLGGRGCCLWRGTHPAGWKGHFPHNGPTDLHSPRALSSVESQHPVPDISTEVAPVTDV